MATYELSRGEGQRKLQFEGERLETGNYEGSYGRVDYSIYRVDSSDDYEYVVAESTRWTGLGAYTKAKAYVDATQLSKRRPEMARRIGVEVPERL